MKTVYIIITFCAGLFLGHLLFPSEKNIDEPVSVEIINESKQIAAIDTAFYVHQAVLEKLNDSLKMEIQTYKLWISDAQKNLIEKREKTFALVKRIKLDSIFRPDSLLFDSLRDDITGINERTDTLFVHYQKKDSLMQEIVAIRDSQLIVCNNSFADLNTLAKEQMQREQKLSDDLKTALKQEKQKRVQNKILAAGMLFVSGIATTLFIKSKP